MNNMNNNFEYLVNTIQEDYKHFNIDDIMPRKAKLKIQERHLDITKLKFKILFQFENHETFEESFYNRAIYLTKNILDKITDDNNNIIDIETYKIILFINVCKTEEIVEEYELIDETFETFNFKNYKKFYDIFTKYFDNKYKDKSIKENEIMSRIKIFDFHYDKIYPHNFNKKDNPVEYNKVSKNKSNLKTQYKKYLEGEDINNLKNIPALKMIIYIIDNVPTDNEFKLN